MKRNPIKNSKNQKFASFLYLIVVLKTYFQGASPKRVCFLAGFGEKHTWHMKMSYR